MKNFTLILSVSMVLAAPLLAKQAAPAATVVATDRFVILEGGRNFRDIGGYQTADGRTVKRGVVYRSGSMGGLTLAGQQQLASLHVGTIIDLRSTAERKGDMNNWLAASGQGYWARDYGMAMGDFSAYFAKPENLTAANMRAMMTHGYKKLAQEQAPSYRQMFARLLGTKSRLVVNCTAGKDRTGIASALLLTALGVPYETVRQDFLLSNNAPGMHMLQSSLSPGASALPPEVAAPLIGVEGEYLDTAFASLREEYGSVEAFMEKELGVGPREVAALKRRMLD